MTRRWSTQIIAMAEDYYPKVHNHVKVGGGQQVLLQVRLMEVSRTKLRSLGVDWANIQSNGSFQASSPSQILKIAQVPLTSVPVNGVPARFRCVNRSQQRRRNFFLRNY